MKIDLMNTYRFKGGQSITGIFRATKKGVGFVRPGEDPDGEDMYIAEADTMGAMDGDLVRVAVVQNGFQIRNVVTEVLEHHHAGAVGIVSLGKNKMTVTPINPKLPDIKIGKKQMGDAAADDVVVVRFLTYGDGTAAPTGKILENLGNKEVPGTDITAIVRELEVRTGFPEDVAEQAREILKQNHLSGCRKEESGENIGAGTEIDSESTESRQGDHGEDRKDLRNLFTLTVDEPGTEDMDDAVSLRRAGDTWELGVHIADASCYVREGTPMDLEARRRGTSTYLPDRVIPMLPEELSDDLCSLKAGEDRRCLSVMLTIDDEGLVKNIVIVPSVIRVAVNLNYPEAQALLYPEAQNLWAGEYGTDHDDIASVGQMTSSAQEESSSLKSNEGPSADSERTGSSEVVRMLKEMKTLSDKLTQKRRERGEIVFDLPDVRIILDEKGLPERLEVTRENDAQKMISAFMIAANESVAKYMADKEIPGIFRVHESPDAEAAKAWRALTEREFPDHGDTAAGESEGTGSGVLTAKEIQTVLEQCKGTESENFLTLSALRMMSHAHYDAECKGHFGLATPYYCHFTSPIRRYPDLVVHRLLHEELEGNLSDERKTSYHDTMADLCLHCSEQEHLSIECERQTTRLKLIQYLCMHLGEEADGIISRVTKNGFFVELPDTCEGFVAVKTLSDDYYSFEEETSCFIGKNTGKTFRLGDPVTIRITATDLKERSVDFELA